MLEILVKLYLKSEQVTTIEETKRFLMFRLDVKGNVNVNSRRYFPVRGQIYLLIIASIYGNFTPIGGGGKIAILGYF